MKKLRSAFSLVLIAASFVSLLAIHGVFPISADARFRGKEQEKQRHHELKTGPEVERRAKQLKQANREVRNALMAFEKNFHRHGRLPKMEESWSITSKVSSSSMSRAVTPGNALNIRKAGFNHQQADSENGIEIIFIPTYSVPGEWQGTIICNGYDSTGNFLAQYVADVVLKQDVIDNSWKGLYEVSFEGGQAYLESDPALGMITDPYFVFGAPSDQQPPDRDPGILPGQISAVANPIFRNASYRPTGTALAPQGWRGRPPGYPPNPRMTQWVKCTTAWCVGTGGVGCGVLSLLSAGVGFGPCAVAACLGSASACGIAVILH